MDATCTIQDSIHVFNLVHKYVSRILGTYQKLKGSKRIGGESCEIGKIPQPEAVGKQVGWGKSWKIGKIPQPEATEKQAGCGKSCETGKIPQPEAIGKQVGWGKSWKIRKIPQIKK